MGYVFRYLYNKSIKQFWIICCIGLCLIPIIIGTFIYIVNINSFHNQTVQNNEAMLMQIRDLTDEAFNDIRHIIYAVTTSDYLDIYQSAHGTTGETVVKMHMIKSLKDSQSNSPNIDEIGIYFPETDEIITNSTSMPLDIAFYNQYQYTFQDCESLRQTFLNVSGQEILLGTDNNGNSGLLIARKVSDRIADSPVILVQLNSSLMNGMIKNVEDYTLCNLNFMLNNSRQYLYRASEQLIQFSGGESSFRPAQDLQRCPIEQKGVISYISSQYFDLTFVLETPWKFSKYEMAKINLYFLGGLFFMLLGSIGLTVTFIKTNYRPVKELLDLAADAGYLPSQGSLQTSVNEYTALKEALSSSKNQSQSMEELLALQQEQLKHSQLALLFQNSAAALQKPEYMSLIKKILPYEYFSVAIFTPDQALKSHTFENSSDEIEKVFSEYMESRETHDDYNWCAYLLKDSEHIFLLFNLNKNIKEKEILVHHISQGFSERLSEKNPEYEGAVVYSVSSVHNGIAEITACYQEADYALRYRMIFGDDFSQEESAYISSLSITKSFYYSADMENRLSNAIISGSGNLAETIFNEIWQMNTVENKVVSEYLYFLLSDITSTVIRTGNMVPLSSDISEHILRSSMEMMKERSIDKLKHEVLMLIHEVSGVYEKEHDRSSERLKQRIYDYIEENYTDPDLNVEAISDTFGRSRTNLFMLFKDETGNSLLYHINRIRIQHAKELLKTTSKSVNSIAEETGFTSAVNFSRVFKKYTSLTPGKYRELNSGLK